MTKEKIWFVTGASKGLGLALVKRLLDEGYRVAATSRTLGALEKEIGKSSDRCLPLEMNLLDEDSVRRTLAATIAHFGTIDVVVNNAGYGQIGAQEELSDAEVRKNFDVNVFGLLNVVRNAMPHLRSRRSGHVFNISSIGGYTANFGGWGIYCATKFAVSALTESLAAETAAFGVHATLVYPGYFRTQFLAKDSVMEPSCPIEDYEGVRQSQSVHLNEINGRQQGDPDRLAETLIQVSEMEQPPVHLFLGSDALSLAREKATTMLDEMAKWRELSMATDFGEVTA